MSKRFDGINPTDTKKSVMRGDGVDLPSGIHCNNATFVRLVGDRHRETTGQGLAPANIELSPTLCEE